MGDAPARRGSSNTLRVAAALGALAVLLSCSPEEDKVSDGSATSSTAAVGALPPGLGEGDPDDPPREVVERLADLPVVVSRRLADHPPAWPEECKAAMEAGSVPPVGDGWVTPDGATLVAAPNEQGQSERCDLWWTGSKWSSCSAVPERFSPAELEAAGGDLHICLDTLVAGPDGRLPRVEPHMAVSVANLPQADWIAVVRGHRWLVLSAQGASVVRFVIVDLEAPAAFARLQVRWFQSNGALLDSREVQVQAAG